MPEGPTMGPSAGPTLAMAVAAAEKAVRKSSPNRPSASASSENDRNHMKKKLSTETMTSSDLGRRL